MLPSKSSKAGSGGHLRATTTASGPPQQQQQPLAQQQPLPPQVIAFVGRAVPDKAARMAAIHELYGQALDRVLSHF